MKLSAARRTQLNALLQGIEQKLTDAHGLPGRDRRGPLGRSQPVRGYHRRGAGRYCDRLDELTALLKRPGQ
jgi:hypothetical protein